MRHLKIKIKYSVASHRDAILRTSSTQKAISFDHATTYYLVYVAGDMGSRSAGVMINQGEGPLYFTLHTFEIWG